MTSKFFRRLTLPLAVLGLLVFFTGAASGRAAVTSFSWQETLSFTETGIVPCFPDLTGTLSGTDAGAGQSVATTSGFHVYGTETQDYRVDFENGTYLLSYSPTHFEFNVNFGSGQSESTAAQQDRGTLYTAAGQAIGSITVMGTTHITWRDLNGNGSPDQGEITADVSVGRITCP